MGVHAQLSNTKRDKQSRKCYKMGRIKKREKYKKFPKKVAEIMDPELMTIHHLKKRRTHPRANITLSGKKKQKILKQLRRSVKEKNEMEVVAPAPSTSKPVSSSQESSKKGGKKKRSKQSASEEMEVEEPEEV
ncbi:uncharacterized protein C11orf98-like [Lineus longissimus]|uniref:uncharacterized protein C11orf98-like n=1 Tax=Lineus longissimus TaxID=88925 RepID=UPI002B4E6CE8